MHNLLEIAKRLHTQDNQCTALPMFCVQRKIRDYGFDPQWTDDVVWIEHESGEYDVSDVEKPGYEKTGYKDHWETVMVAFTKEGCEEYLRKNKHNLGETRIFVESFHRCPEMIAIREFLMGLTK